MTHVDAISHRMSMRFFSVPCITNVVKMHPMGRIEIDREPLREWMREEIRHFGSARSWAKKAHTSPSNITRFLADKDASSPSFTTLSKLAAVFYVPLPQPSQINTPVEIMRDKIIDLLEGVPPERREEYMDMMEATARIMRGEQPSQILPSREAKRG